MKGIAIFFLFSAGLAAQTSETPPVKKAAVPLHYRHSFQKNIKKHSGFGFIVIKSKFKLYVVNRQFDIIESFTAAIGMNPDGKAKLHENDRRTPEGLYRITEILSADNSGDPESLKKLEDMNRVFFKAKDGFTRYDDPSADLGSDLYGPRFFAINYPEKKDWIRYRSHKKKKKLPVNNGNIPSIGYGIAIHGTNDENSIGKKSTNGCVALKNDEVIKLDPYIKLNMPVLILP